MRYTTLLALLVACSGDEGADSAPAEAADTSQDTDAAADDTSGGDSSDTAPDCYELSNGDCVVETFSNPPVLEPDADGGLPAPRGQRAWPGAVIRVDDLSDEARPVALWTGTSPPSEGRARVLSITLPEARTLTRIRVNLYSRRLMPRPQIDAVALGVAGE